MNYHHDNPKQAAALQGAAAPFTFIPPLDLVRLDRQISIENVFEVQDGDVEDNLNATEDWNNINPPTVGTVPGPQQFITGPAAALRLTESCLAQARRVEVQASRLVLVAIS